MIKKRYLLLSFAFFLLCIRAVFIHPTDTRSINTGLPDIPCNEEVMSVLRDAQMDKIYESRREHILLVNANHPLSNDYDLNLVSVDNGNGKMDKQAAADLDRMLKTGREEGLNLQLISSYRTYNYQQSLFQRQLSKRKEQGYTGQEAIDIASTVVAYPGTSEHHTGLAADIVSSSYLNNNSYLTRAYQNTREAQWLAQNCAEYGFILRYPDGKSDYTGIIYEPWHYRWVGQALAQAITQSGLCLEEYLGYDAQY